MADAYVIPPGQGDQVGAMLRNGTALPSDCGSPRAALGTL